MTPECPLFSAKMARWGVNKKARCPLPIAQCLDVPKAAQMADGWVVASFGHELLCTDLFSPGRFCHSFFGDQSDFGQRTHLGPPSRGPALRLDGPPFAFFFLLPLPFSCLSSTLCLLVEFWWCLNRVFEMCLMSPSGSLSLLRRR